MKQIYQCYIKILSPLHIGCDEVYEPMGFVVDESRNELVSFDPITFISKMDENDKKRFSDICSRGTIESILEIYKFLRRRKVNGKSVQLCSGFVGHYNRTLSISTNDKKRIQQELNNFAISRTSFLSADERPYIPGSSVKGSLRTAYLNSLAQSKSIPTPGGKYAASDLEKKLLSYADIPNDPFRLIKISDFMPVGEVQTRVVYAVNFKKESGGAARGPFQIVESIIPGVIFRGNIIVEEPLSDRVIKNPIKLDDLLQSSQEFYSKEHKREHSEMKHAGVSVPDDFFSKGSIPIRLGRHSGAESVTIEGHRYIKIMGGKDKPPSNKDHATTLWLASEESKPQDITNLRIFGWAELCEITPSLELDFEKAENNWKNNLAILVTKADGFPIQTNSEHKEEAIAKPVQTTKQPGPIVWEKAFISYAPNTGEITASFENRKAISKDKSIMPVSLLEKLKKKKKAITANVTVEPYGNSYRLLNIVEGTQ